jgi:hypothetical protein
MLLSGLDPLGTGIHPVGLKSEALQYVRGNPAYGAPEERETKHTEGRVLEPVHYEIHVNGSILMPTMTWRPHGEETRHRWPMASGSICF